ncbi:MAG TPA: GyrI-like domain-containing protein [Kofleriaceae bacterium]|nr:GyrI-like domain-containing protein [Kofleriaceae bacterium]
MDTAPEITNLKAGPAIAIRAQVAFSELPAFFSGAFHELAECGADKAAGPPFAIYHSFDPPRLDVEAAMPLRSEVPVHGRVHAIDLAGGPAVQIRHVGPYEDLGTAYTSLDRWITDHHYVRAAAIREVYVTPPGGPPTELVTLLVQPLDQPDVRAST